MRAVLQRVASARVEIDGAVVGVIDRGLLALVAATHGDGPEDVAWIARKIAGLRCFEDDAGRMNRSVEEVDGGVLVVSQFTLYGNCRKGRRPSFVAAMDPAPAAALIDDVAAALRAAGLPVACGRFGADMQVHMVNDGPVTLLLDSRNDIA